MVSKGKFSFSACGKIFDEGYNLSDEMQRALLAYTQEVMASFHETEGEGNKSQKLVAKLSSLFGSLKVGSILGLQA